MLGFRETTWGKIIVGGLVWCLVYVAIIAAYRYTFRFPSFAIGIAAISFATFFALIATQQRLTVPTYLLATGTWCGTLLAVSAVYSRRSFNGPLEYIGDLTGYTELSFILEGVDAMLPIGLIGSLVYFGGQALQALLSKKDS